MIVKNEDLRCGDVIVPPQNARFTVDTTPQSDGGIEGHLDCGSQEFHVVERIVSDDAIQMHWFCRECYERAVVDPSFYGNSGTPVCGKGDDMVYLYTVVKAQR